MAKRPTKEDLIGLVFGRLTITDLGPVVKGERTAMCQCVCGNTKTAVLSHLKLKRVQSCGCQLQNSIDAMRKFNQSKVTNPDHTAQCAEYRAWQNIKDRCFNPKNSHHHLYGGRGITMHAPWINDFDAFLRDVGRRPAPRYSIDRIENNGNYEPGNVRWALPEVQANNQRKNKMVEHDGRTQTLAQWCHELHLPYGTILARLKKGMLPDQALTRPVIPVGPGHGK